MRVLLVLALVGCGRLGFDESTPGGPTPDAPDPAALPTLCNIRSIGQLAIGTEVPIRVRAVALSTGHALAVQTDANNTYMVRLDASGGVVSTHLPFGGNGYQLLGISQVSDRPFVYVFTSGAGYIKLLVPDWNSYETGPSGEAWPMDPQQALLPDGTTAIYGVIAGGTLGIHRIDATNAILGDADYAPVATSASFGTLPDGARVVVENAGACETFAIAPDGKTSARHQFSPCYEPRLATLGELGAVIHKTAPAGPLALYQIPADPSGIGETTVFEIGTNARIATIGGAIWVGFLRESGGARAIRVTPEAVTMQDYPAISSAFDLLPSGSFWVTSTGELQSATPCL